jgi:hypothetical protein
MDPKTLENGVTHPQIHLDYYNWLKTLSESDEKFLATATCYGIAMWAWSRSREILKEKASTPSIKPMYKKDTERLYTDTDVVDRMKANLECIIADANREITRLEGKRSQAETSLSFIKNMRDAKKS